MNLDEDSTVSVLFAIGFSIAAGITYTIGYLTDCTIVRCLAFGFCIAGLANAIIGVVQMSMHMRRRR